MPGTGKSLGNYAKGKEIQVHFKGTNTLRTLLGNPKDKDPQNNQTGIIYHYQCPQINCPSAYIGESGRALGERVKENFKAAPPPHLHSTTTGHLMDPKQFSIVHKEVNNQSRTIKEAMFIWVQDPTLNSNLGKYQLLYIWDNLLLTSPTLQYKPSSVPTLPTPYLNHPHTGSSHPPASYLGWGHILSWYVHTFGLILPIHPPKYQNYTPTTVAPSW